MYRRSSFFSAIVAATSLMLATAATIHAQPSRRAAGPWYTPQERYALTTYSKASFADKQRILAGKPAITETTRHPLTAAERRALDAYAKASFGGKERILAGKTISTAENTDWHSVLAGAGATLGALLVAAALASRFVSIRNRRRSLA